MLLRRKAIAWLKSKGIEVRKAPSTSYAAVSVFDLAVEVLMSRKGAGLFFVQVGANDGVQFGDPIYPRVVANGWRGILVEPQPHMFERLIRNYREYSDKVIFENIAISPDTSTLTLYCPPKESLDEPGAASGVSTYPDVVAKSLNLRPEQLLKVEVPAMSLDDLLKKHSIKSVDILQIDVEGYDWNVLSSLSLETVRPSIIQFEHGHLSRGDCTEAVKHLDANNYRVYWGGRENDTLAIDRRIFEGQ